MTILSSNQPWPQIQVPVFDFTIGVFGGYKHEIVDKSILDLVGENISHYVYRRSCRPTILFAGPRAWRKIQDLISRDNYIITKTQDLSKNQKREFLGMELILTVDDGLWIA